VTVLSLPSLLNKPFLYILRGRPRKGRDGFQQDTSTIDVATEIDEQQLRTVCGFNPQGPKVELLLCLSMLDPLSVCDGAS
jgi:hypothetical protein